MSEAKGEGGAEEKAPLATTAAEANSTASVAANNGENYDDKGETLQPVADADSGRVNGDEEQSNEAANESQGQEGELGVDEVEAAVDVEGDMETGNEVEAGTEVSGAPTATSADTNPRTQRQFFAVRRGLYVKCCVFLRWKDCRPHVEGVRGAVFGIFDEWEEALAYVTSMATPTLNGLAGQKQSLCQTSAASEEEPSAKRRKTAEGEGELDASSSAAGLVHDEEEVDYVDFAMGSNDHDNTPPIGADEEAAATLMSAEFSRIRHQEARDVAPVHPYDEMADSSHWSGLAALTTATATAASALPAGESEMATTTETQSPPPARIPTQESTPPSRNKPKQSAAWNRLYNELVAFKAEHGHCHPLTSHPTLGRWVSQQRRDYRDREAGKKSPMTDERVTLLQEIGFLLGAKGGKPEDYNDDSFDAKVAALEAYKAETGSCDVPHTHPELGTWIARQRKLLKKFQSDGTGPMTEARAKRLEDLGFVLAPRRGSKPGGQSEDNFDEMYEKLKEYRQQQGDCLVPCRGEFAPLRRFVMKQREEYRNLREEKPSRMTAVRISKLVDLGFVFETRHTPKWDERLEELRKFKEEHGHCVVPRHCPGLGKWVVEQRGKYKAHKEGKPSNLTPERIKALDDLGMVWSVLKQPEKRAEKQPWAVRFQQLLDFKAKNGHTVVPQHYPVLGLWVHQQRVHYKLMKQGRKSLMSPEKALQLADVGFQFEVKARKKNASGSAELVQLQRRLQDKRNRRLEEQQTKQWQEAPLPEQHEDVEAVTEDPGIVEQVVDDQYDDGEDDHAYDVNGHNDQQNQQHHEEQDAGFDLSSFVM